MNNEQRTFEVLVVINGVKRTRFVDGENIGVVRDSMKNKYGADYIDIKEEHHSAMRYNATHSFLPKK